jgi:Protein of unknown function (DUF2393)
MGGLIQPSPVSTERESSLRPILIGAVLVVVILGLVIFAMRDTRPRPAGPPPYASSLKISDLKMSAAENFVGATVSYIDGTLTNNGDKTVTHVVVRVVFRDDMNQVVGDETVPLHVLQTGGPYADTVDLSASPLPPHQAKTFRLSFESISTQWNHAYPEIQIVGVSTK